MSNRAMKEERQARAAGESTIELDLLNQQMKRAYLQLETLWRQAEAAPEPDDPLAALTELSNALHELDVTSEELSHQNEELLNSRQRVEAERRRYQELFDFAPDGYLITDANGTASSH